MISEGYSSNMRNTKHSLHILSPISISKGVASVGLELQFDTVMYRTKSKK